MKSTIMKLHLCVLSLLLPGAALGEGTTPPFNEQRNLYFGDTTIHNPGTVYLNLETAVGREKDV